MTVRAGKTRKQREKWAKKWGEDAMPTWILFDGRARFDVDRAAVLLTGNPGEDDRLAYGDDPIWMDPSGELRFDLSPVPTSDEERARLRRGKT